MKKIIFTILVAVMVLVTAQAGPQKKGSPKTVATEQVVDEAPKHDAANEPTSDDEQETDVTNKVALTNDGIVVKGDNGTVELKIADLYRIINEHLDDTVLSTGNQEISQLDSNDVHVMTNRGMDFAENISLVVFEAIVCIVFFSLLFYYLHRRRKYKTLDRAIQAGYPLPDEFFGKHSSSAPQQPTTVYVTQVAPPTDPNIPHDSQGATVPPPLQSSNPLNNITDWTPFKKGFRTTAVGLGLLLFFWIAGGTPVAALMVIVVFIGLGQLFFAYQEQQNLKNHWQQQWTQQPQQSQQQQWQQWNPQQPPQQPPHNVPPMPETPPEFDPNK